MRSNKAKVYCQNCRASNSLSETHCLECGTRLLLVVFPNSLQYDTNQPPTFYEDHLLERVSSLELTQRQMAEALHGAVEVIREQGQILRDEKDLIKTLYNMLGFLKTEEAEKIKGAWDELTQRRSLEKFAGEKRAEIFEAIVAGHDLPNVELFSHLLNESSRLFANQEEKPALQMLERAILLSPRNVPLHLHFAHQLFFADKFEKAEQILQQTLQLEPESAKAKLLSGAINADFGLAEKARRHLGLLISDDSKLPLVNFVWGMLAAFEKNWTESLAAFKRAAQQREIPEIDYLVGCVYFQLGRHRMALRHLQKAVRDDENFADVWFMQSLIFKMQKDKKRDAEAYEKALKSPEPGAQCLEFLNGKKLSDADIALPFRHFRQKCPRLLTNGSRRLLSYFRSEIRKALD